MEYEIQDFDKMMYNVHQKENLKMEFPNLFLLFKGYKCDDFGGIDQAIKYVVYCYDKHSPLHSIDNYQSKKICAAKLAGYQYADKTGLTDNYAIDIIKGKNQTINQMIVAYLRHNLKFAWSHIVTLTEAYYSAQAKIFEEGFDEKAIKTMSTLKDEIDNGMLQFFKADDEVLETTVLAVMEHEKYGIRLEEIINTFTKQKMYI